MRTRKQKRITKKHVDAARKKEEASIQKQLAVHDHEARVDTAQKWTQALHRARDTRAGTEFDVLFDACAHCVWLAQAAGNQPENSTQHRALRNRILREMGQEFIVIVLTGDSEKLAHMAKALAVWHAHRPQLNKRDAVLLEVGQTGSPHTVKELNDALEARGIRKMDSSQLRRWAKPSGILISGGKRGRPRTK